MPKDEIAQAIHKLQCEIAKLSGENPRHIDKMLQRYMARHESTRDIKVILDDCIQWFLRLPPIITPRHIADFHRSELYLWSLDPKATSPAPSLNFEDILRKENTNKDEEPDAS